MKRGRRSKFPMFTKKASFVCLARTRRRAPLFKTSKIEDIDAYVENRKMVVKTSTLPSFMLPVEENYPIRHNNAVTEDINPNPAPLSRSPERPLLPGTVTTEGDFQVAYSRGSATASKANYYLSEIPRCELSRR